MCRLAPNSYLYRKREVVNSLILKCQFNNKEKLCVRGPIISSFYWPFFVVLTLYLWTFSHAFQSGFEQKQVFIYETFVVLWTAQRPEDVVAEYYQQQVEMLEGFNEMDTLTDRGFLPGMSKVCSITFCYGNVFKWYKIVWLQLRPLFFSQTTFVSLITNLFTHRKNVKRLLRVRH